MIRSATRFLAASAVLFACATSMHAQIWPCESSSGYRECRIGSGGVIRLVMEMSDRRCFEGVSWGTRQGGVVWVDKGCRATFTADNPEPNTRIICESLNGARAVCSANTGKGVLLTRQLSKAECFEGVSWGHDPDLNVIWVDKGCRGEFGLARGTAKQPIPPTLDTPVVCESENGKRKDCAADTASGVQIVRSLTNSPCRFRQEWGFDDTAIWVSDGCHAQFALGGYRLPADAVPPNAAKLVCASVDGKRTECDIATARGVGLVRQISDSNCILNRSWGYDSQGIWVSDGCRAEFVVAK